jgi:hypothetical protein
MPGWQMVGDVVTSVQGVMPHWQEAVNFLERAILLHILFSGAILSFCYVKD